MVAATQMPKPVQAAEPAWRRAFRDAESEHGFVPLRVEGRLPAELRGTLYRNGPSIFGVGGERYQHWFDGDGAITAVRFANGAAEGAFKVVQSQGLVTERAKGERLYGGYGTPPAGPLWKRLFHMGKNAANTSVIAWQGRLLALFEGGKPTELRPEDLSTIGETDLGVIVQSFSAHPHRVAERKASYNFSIRYGGPPAIDLYELPDVGAPRRLARVRTSGAGMVHDFIATPKHLVFFLSPLRLRLMPLLLGKLPFGDALDWRPELGTEILVVPIDAPERAIRFDAEPFFQWHFANAFEEGNELVVDYVRLPDFARNAWLKQLPHGVPSASWNGKLSRARIDLAAKRFTSEPRWDVSCEFPRVGSGVQGRSHRFVYCASHSRPTLGNGLFDELAKLDVTTGQATRVTLGEAQYPSEPVFVRREGAQAEDDGFLLTLVYDGLRDRSHVAVLDAKDPVRGPLARAHFEHPVPFTFHGNFARG